jgi:hypothetical protein
MKRISGFLLLSLFTHQAMAQQSVGIGTATPNTSAVLDLTSTTKGLLIPRMTGAQRNAIASPASGLLVYQTNTVIIPPTSSPGFYVYDGSAWKLIAKDEDIVPPGSSASWTLSGSNQYSTPSGNVGIGTTAPTDKLDVRGSFRLSNGSSVPVLKLYGGASPFFSSQIDFNDNAGNNLNRIGSSAGLLFLATAGHGDHLVLQPDGLITTGAGSALYINGTGNSTSTVRLNDEIPAIEFNTGTTEKGIIRAIGNNMTFETASGNTTGDIQFRMNNSNKLVIKENGSVGIGTSAPAEKLHVAAGDIILDNPNATFRLRDIEDKGFVQLSGDNLRIGCYSSNATGRIIFRNNGADQMLIDENGSVCIGTSNATAKFTVAGQTVMNNGVSNALNVVGKFSVSKGGEAIHISGTDAAINFFNGAQQRGYLWNTGNDMQLGASVGSGRLLLNAAQVRIGGVTEAATDYKVAVAGKVICEELRVKLQSSGWPDYVFSNSYKLPTLEEVEKYIGEHKHLPNIPSAAEVEKDGIAVGDMQKRLMEKVEELTLYVIELKKQIDELKKAPTSEK